jgi:hypothetical protein
MLHITNGDLAVDVLSRAVQGEFLPWRDALHEGPVHAGIPLEDLSHRRAAFIAAAGWAPRRRVEDEFLDRDKRLRSAEAHEEVVLWFEHDLYDQLQLVQLLDWLCAHPHPRLTLVCEAEYLGAMTPARAADLFRQRRAVSGEQLRAGSAAWGAFGSANPFRISTSPHAGLPFLGPSMQRLLEEYPWSGDGLSRLERQALEALRGGPLPYAELFARAHHRREDPVFLGDTVFAWHVGRLSADGLLEAGALTQKARDILNGKADAWAQPRAARWLGGYEVKDGGVRWDPKLARLVRA